MSKREDIKDKAMIVEQLENLERLYKRLINEDKQSWWKICIPSSSYDVFLSLNSTRDNYVKWLSNEIKILKYKIGEIEE